MSDAIQEAKDLRQWFFDLSKGNDFRNLRKSGLFVSTKVRRDILLGVDADKITLSGKVQKIQFENIGGGVWRAFVDSEIKIK